GHRRAGCHRGDGAHSRRRADPAERAHAVRHGARAGLALLPHRRRVGVGDSGGRRVPAAGRAMSPRAGDMAADGAAQHERSHVSARTRPSDRHAHDHEHHEHDHDHGHGVHRTAAELRAIGRRRLTIVLALTAGFMLIEFIGGLLADSLALIADAGHMLSDAGALGLSIFALRFAPSPAPPEKTSGYLRIGMLAPPATGVALVVIALAIFWQAWQRLLHPEPVEGPLMLVVAAAGLAVNIVAALLLHGSAGHNLNVRGAYLHVLGDLLGSVGAIAAGLII